MTKTEFYIHFLYGLRKIELSDEYIMLGDNITPKVHEYCLALDMCNFVDGSYHTYFGEIKNIIDVFVNYWTETIDDVIKQVDRYTNVITKDELLNLVEGTISMQKRKQVEFGKEFLPVKTQSDQELYEEIEEKYKAMLKSLFQLKERIERFDKQSYVEEYVKRNLKLSINKINECFQFTHTHISIEMGYNVYKIRVSLEEILARVRNNLHQLEDKRDKEKTDMYNQLYERNKELMYIARQERSGTVDRAEVTISITGLREQIENPIINMPITYLTNEVEYWETRLSEFNKIENVIIKIKKAQESAKDLENEYNKISSAIKETSRLGCEKNLHYLHENEKKMGTINSEDNVSRYHTYSTCFVEIGENIKLRKEYLDEKMILASKALFTFFGIRGSSKILYKDNIGKYNVDRYGHQVYFLDYGNKQYHVKCDGTFNEVKYTDKYYYDVGGRYIVDESGEKVYQVAPCTSEYKLGKNGNLFKTTIDCGHSDKANPKCKMVLKDPTDVGILPDLEPMDIKDTLKPEVVKYLWDCFGHVVPEAMRDVGDLAPKNPIHVLAHRIISQKYSLTPTELKKKAKEAEKYRAEILKKRKDKRIAESKAWRSKQVARRKPEESDDSQDWAAYNEYLSQNQFISFLDH